MGLYLVTAVTTEPVTLAEAKAYCRVDHDDENTLLTALISSARQHCETFTHRALAPQTWDYKADVFPCGWYGPIVLPKPPVTSITSVSYLDTNGDSQTWASANYTTDLPTGDWSGPGRIVPIYGTVYPPTRSVINAVTVRFVAGYVTCPEAIKAAMKMLIAHWYKTREPVVVGTITSPVQQTIDALLWPFKHFA